jgi:hypothetical protein
MATPTLDPTAIQINKAQLFNMQRPDPDYQGRSFARWEQQGMLASAWLETVEAGQWPTGIFVPDAYNLTCNYDRVAHQGALGKEQEALGREMVDQLRARVVDAMHVHGWIVIYKTKAGRDIWHQEPDPRRQLSPALEPNSVAEEEGAPAFSERDLPDIVLGGTAFLSTDDGMSAQDCSVGSRGANLTCTTTKEMWECFTSLSMANMLEKPIALSLWGAVSANGKPVPCANTTRNRKGAPASKHCQSVLAFRTRQGQHVAAEVLRFVKSNRHVNGIANARRSIPPKSLSD